MGRKEGHSCLKRKKSDFDCKEDEDESMQGRNYWLAPDGKTGEFVLHLGCERIVNFVDLVNTHNSDNKDRSTKRFKVFVKKQDGNNWEEVLDKTLPDTRRQKYFLDQVLTFQFDNKRALLIKFKILDVYGKGGGLNYFATAEMKCPLGWDRHQEAGKMCFKEFTTQKNLWRG